MDNIKDEISTKAIHLLSRCTLGRRYVIRLDEQSNLITENDQNQQKTLSRSGREFFLFLTIQPVNQLHAPQQQAFIIDELPAAVGNNALGQTAGGQERAFLAQLRLKPLRQPVHHSRRAEYRAALNGFQGCAAYGLLRRLDGYRRELRCSGYLLLIAEP